MNIHGEATEAEMVAAFLKGELSSARFGKHVAAGLARLGETPSLITEPDLTDPAQNAKRIEVLRYRGFGPRTNLFLGFPTDVRWQAATITHADCCNLKVLNEGPWISLARATRLAMDAAAALAQGDVQDDVVSSIPPIKAKLRAGEVLPPVILVGSSGQPGLVILEGHARVMAAIGCGAPVELPAFIGTSSKMRDWSRF